MTQAAIEDGIYDKIAAGAGTALYGTRIYIAQAPSAATLPYVIFQRVGGGEENMTPTRSIDVLYQVECWASTMSDARTGAGYIETALHQSPITASGYTVMWQSVGGWITDTSNVEGKQYYRRGFEVRIRATT